MTVPTPTRFPGRWHALLGLTLALAGLAAYAQSGTKEVPKPIPTPQSLAEADKLYAEKSYAGALLGYQSELKAGRVPAARRDDVEYRVVVSQGKTEKWDQAVAGGLEFIKRHRGTVWEPRALYWMGRLYLGVPHNGWKVGKRLYRGNDIPKTNAAEQPEQVFLQEQDFLNARDALEAARVLYPQFRTGRGVPDEEIQLDFDLAKVLPADPRYVKWLQAQAWAGPADPQWQIDPDAVYDLQWPTPKKERYLYAQIRKLAEAQRKPHFAALSLFGEALWQRQYQRAMKDNWAVKWEPQPNAESKRIDLPYPYQDLQAEAFLRQLVQQYPADPVRDQAQFTIAQFLHQDGKLVEAEREARRFLEERPGSKWSADARVMLHGITHREVYLGVGGSQPAGKPARFNISSRNVKSVHFTIYRVRLEDVLTRPGVASDPRVQWTNWGSNWGALKDAGRFYGPKVAEWDYDAKDQGDHQQRTETITAPVKERGAYVVESSASGARAATVMLVSDIAVVQKLHRDGALFFVADSGSGKPIRDAEVIAKQYWWEGGSEHSAISRGRTSGEGLLNLPLLRAAGRQNFRVAALAYRRDRYAVTTQTWSQDYGDNPDRIKVYSVTDRSVYRPMQTVHYRELMLRRQGGEMLPVTGKKVHVQVYNPRGQIIHESDQVSSPYGSVNGEFNLTAGAPLGEYQVYVTLPTEENGPTQLGGNRFRVEEYKKPEFKVTVEPVAERVRLGQPTSAKVSAKYYFGGPVPNAKVTYRVYRNYWAQSYRFPRPFDFLYRYWNNGDYNYNHRQGEVIAQGEARTDAQGEATVKFETAAAGFRWQNQDLAYTVEADVQDASRRVISGEGAVKATRHDVAVFLDYPHGYASKGDRLDVEVRTLNPSDQPVATTGTARVYRQPETPKAKERLVHEEPFQTDVHGYGLIHWTAPEGGYYRIAYETRDTAEEKVEGSTMVWVQGPELEKGKFLFQGVALQVENPFYEQEQTAKVLLITPAEGCTVLLTREANNEILERQVLHISGRSRELKVPLTRRDVPNVYLSAVLLRGEQMLQAQAELFVPPVREFQTVTVKADKERYQPGEKAKFTLHAADWQGRPLRTELSVSVSDAALAYIQKDYAPDIRLYYHGDRRSESVTMQGSPGTGFEQGTEDTQPAESIPVHQWVLPEGMGQLPDWPGEQRQNMRYRGLSNGIDSDLYFARDSRMAGLGGFGGGGLPMNAPAGAAEPASLSAATRAEGVDKLGMLGDFAKKAAAKGDTGADEEGSVRSKFADTAFWTPAVVTDGQGNATVEVSWPDNLTQWRAYSVGISRAAQVGSGETRVTTKKDVLVRLEAPRFFVERDTLLLSASVHNYTDQAAKIKVRLDLEGGSVRFTDASSIPAPRRREEVPFKAANVSSNRQKDARSLGQVQLRQLLPRPSANQAEVWVDVLKDGETRVDWPVQVQSEGEVRARVSAQSTSGSDAMEMEFPALVHGVERQVAQNGVLRTEKEQTAAIELPQARKPGSSELVVQLNPSLGAVMLDALPYLADYPYGCIEQTMSRFLPSVVVAKTLKDQGIDLPALRKRWEARVKAQAEGDKNHPGGQTVKGSPYTYPKGQPGQVRTELLDQGMARWKSPVFDPQTLRDMVRDGLDRIQSFQHPDGGWGWWPADSSDPYMTAYVLYGLITCRDAGETVDPGMLERGLNYLKGRFLEDDNFHRMAYEARVLGMDARYRAAIRPLTTGRLYDNRERLTAYSKALLAMALHEVGDQPKAEALLRNIESTAKVDPENGTVNWGGNDRFWWYWWNNKVETNAAVLQAYLQIRPDGALPDQLARWMVNNRRGNIWYSTRETSWAVLALSDYVRVRKELSPEYTVTVDLGGRVQRSYTVTRENALLFDNAFIVPDALLETGSQPLKLVKDGPGTLYWSAYTRYFSLEEPVKATGNEIFVKRRYFRLLPLTATGAPEYKPVDQERPNPFLTAKYELLEVGGEWVSPNDVSGGPRYDRVPLSDGDTITSGDQVEVELQLESKNDYEYLVFEDLKPAGCEPVELRSGYHGGLGICSNMELRDQKVAFFLSYLPQGTCTLTYRLRAEIPGAFHVLPTNGYAMYAPDIRCLSDEQRLSIRDRLE